MKCDVAFMENEGLIYAKLEGKTDTVTAISTARKLKEAVKRYENTRLLLNYSECSIDMTTIEKYTLPDKVDTLDFPRHIKAALIISSGRENDCHFIETVFRNTGYLLKVFEDEQSAREWLLS